MVEITVSKNQLDETHSGYQKPKSAEELKQGISINLNSLLARDHEELLRAKRRGFNNRYQRRPYRPDYTRYPRNDSRRDQDRPKFIDRDGRKPFSGVDNRSSARPYL